MKKAKFCLFVLALAISFPFAGYFTQKYSSTNKNELLVEFKSQNQIIPDVYYQKTAQASYSAENVKSSYQKDKKTGFASGRFVFPDGKLFVVRLDFGSNPGAVSVRKLIFKNNPITADILKKSNFQNIYGIEFPKETLLKFNTAHADPYIIFPPQLFWNDFSCIWIFTGVLAVAFTALSAILFLLVKLIKRFEVQKKD